MFAHAKVDLLHGELNVLILLGDEAIAALNELVVLVRVRVENARLRILQSARQWGPRLQIKVVYEVAHAVHFVIVPVEMYELVIDLKVKQVEFVRPTRLFLAKISDQHLSAFGRVIVGLAHGFDEKIPVRQFVYVVGGAHVHEHAFV